MFHKGKTLIFFDIFNEVKIVPKDCKKHIPPKDKISFLFDIFQADECKSNNLCVGRFFYNTNTLTLFYFYTQITLYSYLIYLSAP